MQATSEAAVVAGDTGANDPASLEAVFQTHYCQVARTIAGIIRDPGRAEELAVEVFLRLPSSQCELDPAKISAWLRRTAIRIGLDELRRQARRRRFEELVQKVRFSPRDPEQIQLTRDNHDQVGRVLSRLKRRTAELLLLRAQDLSYEEIASSLSLNPSSIGTLINRAQQAFRKEYIKLYGKTD